MFQAIHCRVKALLRFVLVPLAVLLTSAAPGPIMIPNPKDPRHVLVIPHDSPVTFKDWEDGEAVFEGQFVLTGGWSYGCAFGCSDPPVDADFQFEMAPEKELVARLPHWTTAGQSEDYGFGDNTIIIVREEKLVSKVVDPILLTALRDEKVPSDQGRTSIIVDEFSTGFSCDSTYFSARFVAMAEPPKLAKAQPTGVGSCS